AGRKDGHSGLHSTFHPEECLRFGPRAEITAQLRHPYAEQLSCDTANVGTRWQRSPKPAWREKNHREKKMQKETAVSESEIVKTASKRVVLTVLSQLNNGKVEEALAGFAEEFRFKDHGLELEFTDKKRLAEFFEKTREFFPDTWLQADAIRVIGERVVTEWTLNATFTEPSYGVLK